MSLTCPQLFIIFTPLPGTICLAVVLQSHDKSLVLWPILMIDPAIDIPIDRAWEVTAMVINEGCIDCLDIPSVSTNCNHCYVGKIKNGKTILKNEVVKYCLFFSRNIGQAKLLFFSASKWYFNIVWSYRLSVNNTWRLDKDVEVS